MCGKQCPLIMLAELANFNQTQLFGYWYIYKQAPRVPMLGEKKRIAWNC